MSEAALPTPGGGMAARLRRIQDVITATQTAPGPGWAALFLVALSMLSFGAWRWALQLREGFQLTGLNRPVGWGVLITDFVFWVGIAHSGTLISAILYLFRARFRTAVYRAAEAMTVFAVATAGLFPVIHLGRAWFAYWIFPYPNQRDLWVNFKSPLVWDAFAISTYFLVSSFFLITGLMPDAASLRDQAKGWRKRLYALVALGWQGTDEEWRHHGRGYLLFAAFATPLVISVHSVVSWDFAVSLVPGWHSTLFPPYFVAGAILSGVAMVITLLIPLRRALHLEELVEQKHLDLLSRLVLLTSLIVAYSYSTEFFFAFRGAVTDDRAILTYRATGDYRFQFWLMVLCNCVVPLSLFFKKVRNDNRLLLPVCLAVNVGMYLERFNIIVTSLSHNRVPFDWHTYSPTIGEIGITIGSFGWFFCFLLIFLKLMPAVAVAELKEDAVGHGARHGEGDDLPVPPAPSRSARGAGGLLAVFTEPAQAAASVRALRKAGFGELRASMPAPFPELMEALGRPTSPIGGITVAGAAIGGGLGLALAAGSAWAWPLPVGGKPVVALPAFVVIIFESGVLFGALTNFLGILAGAYFGRRARPVPFDARFSHDRVGLFIPGAATGAEPLLVGAEEVRRVP